MKFLKSPVVQKKIVKLNVNQFHLTSFFYLAWFFKKLGTIYLPITTSSSVLSCPIHSNLKLFKVCDSLL